jgi:site-specific recombinase XerD
MDELDSTDSLSLGLLCENLLHRAMLMLRYSTGIRRAELCRLKVSDGDSQRMIPQCVGPGARFASAATPDGRAK